MGEMIVIIVLLAALCIISSRFYFLKKDVYDFGRYLDECLDQMISGKEMRQMEEAEESMWGKTYDKLKKLDYIWKKQRKKSIDDKRKMKELISDISHQTRTPAANMKLYLEILKQEDLTQEERNYYLEKLEIQEEKLEFFMESLVKMSRLESEVLTLHMDDRAVSATLGKAVAAIVPKAQKSRSQSMSTVRNPFGCIMMRNGQKKPFLIC